MSVYCSLILALLPFWITVASSAVANQPDTEATLRAATQELLDAIAPGDVTTWDHWLDPEAIQVDENDVVRGKAEILKELAPLGAGLTGHLKIDAFFMAQDLRWLAAAGLTSIRGSQGPTPCGTRSTDSVFL